MPALTECAPRYATARSPERETLGRAAVRVAQVLGRPLMPWQRRVVDVALEVNAAGRLVYGDVVLTVPRQSGKSYLLLVLQLTRGLLEPRSSIVYSAQSALDARKKLADDWLPMVLASPLGSQVTPFLAPGREALRFANGSLQQLVASTATAGHGLVVDLGILDEAFSQRDARWEQAIRPAQMTRPDPQLWIVSTAGVRSTSEYLWERVQSGRLAVEADVRDALAYFEWSAEDDADPADAETWRGCMPALGHTVSEDTVAVAQKSMARSEFARGYLNRWVAAGADPIVELAAWEALAEPDAAKPDWTVLGVDVSPKGASAAIVAVGERGGLLYGAVLEAGEGTDWLLPALGRRLEDGQYVVVDERAVEALLHEIKSLAGVGRVIALGARDVSAACAFWLRIVNEGKLRHRGESELLVALDGAGQRTLGDGWAWSRAKSGSDISSLCALTWGVEFYRGSWGTT